MFENGNILKPFEVSIYDMENIIAQGAEAILIRKKDTLIKRRVSKGYRHPQLDSSIRKLRTRRESRIIDKLSNIISSPKIIKTDEKNAEIEMKFIPGLKLSDNLDKFPIKKALNVCRKIGEEVAIMHGSDIIHGDLTTSNMILWRDKIWIIDLGLGFTSNRIEDRAVDLHLIKQALESKHFVHWHEYLNEIISGYKNYKKSDLVLKQLETVESRGRYKGKH